MTQKDLDFIKNAFFQIIDDIVGNPDWCEAVRVVASDLGTLERELKEKVIELPSNLDKTAIDAAQLDMQDRQIMEATNDERQRYSRIFRRGFKAGAEWMAGQGWIDDGSMPPETKKESDTLQGHREWTESKPVLVWDSVYGCRVDWTRNGKWTSEQMGGYTGQVCHGIIAWRPIPEYKEKQ